MATFTNSLGDTIEQVANLLTADDFMALEIAKPEDAQNMFPWVNRLRANNSKAYLKADFVAKFTNIKEVDSEIIIEDSNDSMLISSLPLRKAKIIIRKADDLIWMFSLKDAQDITLICLENKSTDHVCPYLNIQNDKAITNNISMYSSIISNCSPAIKNIYCISWEEKDDVLVLLHKSKGANVVNINVNKYMEHYFSAVDGAFRRDLFHMIFGTAYHIFTHDDMDIMTRQCIVAGSIYMMTDETPYPVMEPLLSTLISFDLGLNLSQTKIFSPRGVLMMFLLYFKKHNLVTDGLIDISQPKIKAIFDSLYPNIRPPILTTTSPNMFGNFIIAFAIMLQVLDVGWIHDDNTKAEDIHASIYRMNVNNLYLYAQDLKTLNELAASLKDK